VSFLVGMMSFDAIYCNMTPGCNMTLWCGLYLILDAFVWSKTSHRQWYNTYHRQWYNTYIDSQWWSMATVEW